MATSRLLVRLIFLLFFAWFAITATASATSSSTTTTTLKRQPGFLYTRTRGRCTPQFWSSRKEAWPTMVPQTSTVSNVFGSIAFERYRSDMTLLESTGMNEEDEDEDENVNVYGKLMKQASAALINSYARKGFPYSAWEVKTLMIQGLVSEDAAARLTKLFSIANDACL